MPEPDGARLGSGPIHLDAEGVQFAPRRREAWRGTRTVSLPYSQIVGLSMTEPKRGARGRLTARLGDGETLSMSFGAYRLPEMRRVYAEVWRRVRAARAEEVGRDQ